MKRTIAVAIALVSIFPLTSDAISNGKSTTYREGGVVLRVDRNMGAILSPGEELTFSYQSHQDAYVIIYNIDTEGFVHLLSPAPGDRLAKARALRTYRFPDTGERLVVEGTTGIEFVFALTVPSADAIDNAELEFLARQETMPRSERYRIDGDPFLAANIIAGELVRGIANRPGVFMDYTYFYVNERVAYPCYLCGECEGGASQCDGIAVSADFDRGGTLTYPLRRAYRIGEEDASYVDVAENDRVYYDTSDDEVDVSFYPYRVEVHYATRPWAYSWDVDYYSYYDPLWYDPWSCGWYYYPSGFRYSYWGHYSSWSFNWGWGGYYCSSYYWPRYWRYYDCFAYNYYDYYHGYGRDVTGYKTKYKTRTAAKTALASGSSLRVAHAQASKRDGKLRIGTTGSRTRVATKTKARAYERGNHKPIRSVVSKRSYPRTRVKNATRTITRPRSGIDSRKIYRPRSRSQTIKNPRSGTRKYTPSSRSRSGSSRKAVKRSSRSHSSRKSQAVKRSSRGDKRSKSSSVKRSSSRSRKSSASKRSGSSRSSKKSSSKKSRKR